MRIRFGQSRTATPRPLGLGGRIGLTLFFSVFLGMGLIFTALIVREFLRSIRSRSWPTTPAEVLASSVEQSGDNYKFTVRYRYQRDGRDYESSTYHPNYGGDDDYGKEQRLAERYPVGAKTVCHVNPACPDEAVLELRSAWIALFLPLPLIFVAVGAGVIWFTWRSKTDDGQSKVPISSPSRQANGPRVAAFVFAIFAIVGAVIFYSMTVRTFLKIQAARSWTATPCVVESSRVKSHPGDDGTTYSVDILYRYEVQGREFRSNKYGFMGGSSSGHDGKAEIVRQFPPGRETECFVNPADPTEAVLVRGFTPMMLFGLLPLVFLLVGVGGLAHFARGGFKTKPVVPVVSEHFQSAPAALKPQASPIAKVIGMLLAAAFWNGIVSVFLWQAVKSWQRGHPEYFLCVFLIPFVLIGLGLLGGVGYFFLALFNPRVRLTVGAQAVPIGGAVDLQWQMSGRTSALQRLEIFLEGREEATYQRGTTSVTDKGVFATIPVIDTTNSWEMPTGNARLMVPPDTMHTFRAEHNKILWFVRIRGEIPRWPDVKEECEINVLPP